MSVLDGVVSHHTSRLAGNPFVQELRDKIATEVQLFFDQIISYADNKKAELDAKAAAAAQ